MARVCTHLHTHTHTHTHAHTHTRARAHTHTHTHAHMIHRYEDMHLDMPAQLRRLAKFLGPPAEARLEATICFSSRFFFSSVGLQSFRRGPLLRLA